MNYGTPNPAEYVSLWIKSGVSSARLVSAEGTIGALKNEAECHGATLEIPSVLAYCAVEINKRL